MKWVVFFVTGLLIVVSIWSLQDARGEEYEKGRKLYDDKCQICHGKNGKGDGPAAAGLNPKPADFNDPKFWQQKDVDKLIGSTIKNGHGPMPAFEMKPDETKAVVDYMEHTFRPK